MFRPIAFLLLTLFAVVHWSEPAAGQNAEPADRKKGKFTVSKETTYITGPLDKDGYPDYAAAVNERLSQGVTSENNANVLLWQTFGPSSEILEPARFFKALGIPEPPNNGDHFVDLDQYEKKHVKVDLATYHKWLRGYRRPWTAREYPDLAAWIKLNEKHLARIVEASKRTHCYSPVLPRQTKKGPAGLASALYPGFRPTQAVVEALVARAMLRTGEGDASAAWQDLLAVHRLARLVGRGGSLLDDMVLHFWNGMACKADLEFLDHTRPNAMLLEGYLDDLQKLPSLPEVADRIDGFERLLLLETVLRLHRMGLAAIYAVPMGETDAAMDRVLDGLDWDATLRHTNQWYDRLVAVMREKDRAAREKKLDQIDAELKPLKAKLLKPDEESFEELRLLFLRRLTWPRCSRIKRRTGTSSSPISWL